MRLNLLRNERSKYYLSLLGLCIVTFCGILLGNWLDGRSTVGIPDGYSLYMNFFVYEGELLREFLGSLFGGGVFEFPAFTFSEGYGADLLLTTAGSFNDPLNLISVFFTVENAQYAYSFLVFVRFYLAAVAFSVYCRSRGNKALPSLCASLCYATCGYIIFWGVLRHANFVNVAILFPLVLTGADRIFEGKSPALFVGALFVQFMLSLYFTYMLLILTFVYCVLQYFLSARQKGVRDFLLLLGKFAVFIVASAAMAAVIVIPEYFELTSIGRVSAGREIPLVYTLSYYGSSLVTLVGSTGYNLGMYLGPLSLVCVVAFVFSRKVIDRYDYRICVAAFVLCVIAMVFPWFGHMLNGFSYSSDRWMFGWGFVCSYMVCLMLPAFARMTKKAKIAAGIVVGVLAVLGCVACVAMAKLYEKLDFTVLVAFGLVVLAAVAMFFLAKRLKRRVFYAIALALVIVPVSFTTFTAQNSAFKSGSEDFLSIGGYLATDQVNPFTLLEGEELDPDARVDMITQYHYRNMAVRSGVKGVDYLSSFYNQEVDDFRRSVALSDRNSNYIFGGSDARYAVQALTGCKYVLVKEKEGARVPTAYSPAIELSNGSMLYETDAVLPLVLTYGKVMSEDEFYGLSPAERQEAMLEYMVLEDAPAAASVSAEGPASVPAEGLSGDAPNAAAAAAPAAGFEAQSVQVIQPAVAYEGTVQEGDVVSCKENNAVMRLTADVPPDSEVYLCLEGIEFLGTDKPGSEAAQDKSLFKTLKSNLRMNASTTPNVIVKAPGFSRTIALPRSNSSRYTGITDFAVNLGRLEAGANEITLTFTLKGHYKLDKCEVVAIDNSKLEQSVAALKAANRATVLSFDDHSVAAEVDGPNDLGYVYFSVPYSKGWTATVDGQPANIERANIGFTAVEVPAEGHHVIELYYQTPGLVLGATVSAVSIVVVAAVAIVLRMRSRKAGK